MFVFSGNFSFETGLLETTVVKKKGVQGALFSNSQAPTAIHGQKVSLRSRRVEVVGTRKNERARRRHAPCVSPSCASVLSFAHYFQAPAPQATTRFTKSGY